jgi:DNA invertase Pin-like site-specific DNA recombinase
LDGKIDLILTKSVSRFARNTVDSLTTVRQLKEKGVEVYFEKENIYTLDSKGELLITIMSSLAQEESRSISENVTWGQRKRMADGKVTLPYKHFLGYEKGEDGLPKIVESQAATIRLIYSLFLKGKSVNTIARELMARNILTPTGKQNWSISTILSILTNEKYKGDARLQKTFTVDFLTKKQKVNEGEIPHYYVENSHPAIITPEAFDLVQYELQTRRTAVRFAGGDSPFSGKILCGECSGLFGSKVWHSTDQYRRVIWRCNNRYKQKGTSTCSTPHVTQPDIEKAFVRAFNQFLKDKTRYIAELEEVLPVIIDTGDLDQETETLTEERDIVVQLIRNCVEDNAHAARDQEAFRQKYDALVERFETAQNRLDSIATEKRNKSARKERIALFLDTLRGATDLITDFDEDLWLATMDTVIVHEDKNMIFTFKDGSEIAIKY